MTAEQASELIEAINRLTVAVDSVEWLGVILPVVLSALVTVAVLAVTIVANSRNTRYQIAKENKNKLEERLHEKNVELANLAFEFASKVTDFENVIIKTRAELNDIMNYYISEKDQDINYVVALSAINKEKILKLRNIYKDEFFKTFNDLTIIHNKFLVLGVNVLGSKGATKISFCFDDIKTMVEDYRMVLYRIVVQYQTKDELLEYISDNAIYIKGLENDIQEKIESIEKMLIDNNSFFQEEILENLSLNKQ